MPGTRRNFAGVSGSPGSVHALRQAAQLAHHREALLIPVLAWLPPDSPPRPPEPRSQPEPETAKAYVSNTLRNRRSRTFGEIRTYPGRAGSAVLGSGTAEYALVSRRQEA